MSLNPIVIFRQIKGLFKIKSEVTSMSFSELKTSEGRQHIALQLITIGVAILGFLPAVLAAKISVALFGIYATSRTIIKALKPIAEMTKTTNAPIVEPINRTL